MGGGLSAYMSSQVILNLNSRVLSANLKISDIRLTYLYLIKWFVTKGTNVPQISDSSKWDTGSIFRPSHTMRKSSNAQVKLNKAMTHKLRGEQTVM